MSNRRLARGQSETLRRERCGSIMFLGVRRKMPVNLDLGRTAKVGFVHKMSQGKLILQNPQGT